jgi:hypothetical protein
MPPAELPNTLGLMLDDVPVGGLRSALLLGFQCGDFSPLDLMLDPSPELQLRGIFMRAEPHAQEKLKQAVVGALAEWRRGAHSEETFGRLSHLALDIGATDAVPLIAQRVRLEEQKPSELSIALVGVLAGFSPLPEARHALERLRSTPLGEATAATVLNGLCRCDPETFPRHLSWFFKVARRTGAFHLGLTMSELIRTVGLTCVNTNMDRLSGADFGEFLRLAQQGVLPKLTLITTEHKQLILCPLQAPGGSQDADPFFEPPLDAPAAQFNGMQRLDAHRWQLRRKGGVATQLQMLANQLGEPDEDNSARLHS